MCISWRQQGNPLVEVVSGNIQELTLARVRLLVESCGALFHTSSFVENTALHTLQAVGPQGAFTSITAPVTLWKKKCPQPSLGE